MLGLLGLGVVFTLARHLRRPADAATPPAVPAGRDPVARMLVAAIVIVATGFAAVDLRYNMAWDGFQIWASKAQLLFYRGGLTPSWYSGDTYELRHVTYPFGVPLYEALLSVVRGGFDFERVASPCFCRSMSRS